MHVLPARSEPRQRRALSRRSLRRRSRRLHVFGVLCQRVDGGDVFRGRAGAGARADKAEELWRARG
eukprot:scaffold439042_cov34-Prasinocladus_malaysianus.AAC.1